MSTRSTVARRLLRVPEITLYFWIIKGLSTAMGESTSDYLVKAMDPVVAAPNWWRQPRFTNELTSRW